ncbi:hypothetical protein GPA27_28750 [Aromatoleum toluolicum]|uniref:hypothetical protein n=1 Tax=Aromatoleum toluolicum TaxID=90060 RepID=UPI00145DC36D|nr:hypothetical protein [Aromatoleum toluolicum]MCQ6963950.1 hypothetical protein [Aromatoleum toluolicum]
MSETELAAAKAALSQQKRKLVAALSVGDAHFAAFKLRFVEEHDREPTLDESPETAELVLEGRRVLRTIEKWETALRNIDATTSPETVQRIVDGAFNTANDARMVAEAIAATVRRGK